MNVAYIERKGFERPREPEARQTCSSERSGQLDTPSHLRLLCRHKELLKHSNSSLAQPSGGEHLHQIIFPNLKLLFFKLGLKIQ